jgi:hypothetical protein
MRTILLIVLILRLLGAHMAVQRELGILSKREQQDPRETFAAGQGKRSLPLKAVEHRGNLYRIAAVASI